MKNFLQAVFMMVFVSGCGFASGQCTINFADTTIGFTPATPAVVRPGVAYAQTVQVYVPATYNVYTVDSLHIDNITGMPAGITYVVNPVSGTVLGGSNGAMCFAGTTTDTVGPYPLTFYGNIYTDGGPIPFSYLVTLVHSFGYKFRVETAPVASFTVDSPVCTNADTVKFIDHTTGYPTNWKWFFTGGSPATSTSEFPSVVYDTAGTYAVTLIGRNSISADTLTDSITVYPSVYVNVATAPAIGDSSASNGSAIALVMGGTPPFTYAWSNSTFADTLQNAAAGIYSLTTTDANGCGYVNDTVNVSLVYVNGIVQLSAKQQVNIYPNPATDVLNLVWSEPANAAVAIIDLNGNVLRSFICNGTMNNTCDVHDLAAGAYIVRITDKINNKQQSVLFSKF